LIVAMPLALALARRFLPETVDQIEAFAHWRLMLSGAILILALAASHLWLPAGRRGLRDVLPGILLTLACWLAAALAFGAYLAGFANYVGMYAGLAGIVVALVFLYLMSAIFLFGAEFNAALKRIEFVNAIARIRPRA
jgi:membrane protein